MFVEVLTQQATQREAAEKWGVDRSIIISICRTAKQGALDALASARPGRPGKTAEQAELDDAKAEIERFARDGDRAGRGVASAAGKIAVGLTAGPVPPRADATVKAGLLELAAHAQSEGGWSLRKAAAPLGLDHARLLRWQQRAVLDRFADAKPGPEVALHALLDWERAAIVKLAENWAEVDRSHRKLAHRGSRLELVYVSESTVPRVLLAEGVVPSERPARERRDKRPFPEWAELVPGVIFIYDFERHFAGLPKWCAIAIIDVVSRKWLSTVVSAEETSTQVEIAFTRALVEDGKEYLLDQPLLDELTHGVVPDNDERVPVLLGSRTTDHR